MFDFLFPPLPGEGLDLDAGVLNLLSAVPPGVLFLVGDFGLHPVGELGLLPKRDFGQPSAAIDALINGCHLRTFALETYQTNDLQIGYFLQLYMLLGDATSC